MRFGAGARITRMEAGIVLEQRTSLATAARHRGGRGYNEVTTGSDTLFRRSMLQSTSCIAVGR